MRTLGLTHSYNVTMQQGLHTTQHVHRNTRMKGSKHLKFNPYAANLIFQSTKTGWILYHNDIYLAVILGYLIKKLTDG